MSLRSLTTFHGYTGVSTLYANLPNVAGSTFQTSLLQQGDHAYVASEKKWYVCDIATPGAAVWVTSLADNTGLRRSYGDATVVFKDTPTVSGGPGLPPILTYPASAASIASTINTSGGNQHFITSFSEYRYSTTRLQVFDGSGAPVGFFEGQFADLSAVASWINSNVAVGGGGGGASFSQTVTLEVYDILDNALVPPAKVYGKNRFWANAANKDKGKYWSLAGRRSFTAVAGTPFGNILAPAVQALMNAIWPGIPVPTFNTLSSNDWGLLWASPDYRNRYNMPGFRPESCFIPNGAHGGNPALGSPDRFAWDGVSVSLAPVDDFRYDTNAAGPYYLIYKSGGSGANFFSAAKGMRRDLARALRDGDSAVLCYPLVNKEQTHRCLYIKPVGIDQLYFGQFDLAKYRLEAVGTFTNDKRPRLKDLGISLSLPSQRTTNPFAVNELVNSSIIANNSTWIAGRHSDTSGRAKFQYRDLSTGRVSPLSSATLTTVARKRGRPVSWLVVNESDV